MRTLKLTLQYDGTDYVGWQRQAAGTSIQGLLEDALRPIEKAAVTVHGAGRTDAGVHALGQVASIALSSSIDPETLTRALNAVLPADVRVVAAEAVAETFHARFSASGKRYRYRVLSGAVCSPFEHRYVWHVPQPLDREAMASAAVLLEGRHDFSAFAAAGGAAKTNERTITRIRVNSGALDWPAQGPLVTFEVEGDGFLRHMVRNIVGTLVPVGLGRSSPSEVGGILASCDRSRAGATAPASGLFLVEVLYGSAAP